MSELKFEFKSKIGICFISPPIGFSIYHETEHSNYTEIIKYIPEKCKYCGNSWNDHGLTQDTLKQIKYFLV